MDPPRPPFQHNPGFVFNPTQLQAAQAVQEAYTSYVREHLQPSQPFTPAIQDAYTTYLVRQHLESGNHIPTQQPISCTPSYFQPYVPTSSADHNPSNIASQPGSTSAEPSSQHANVSKKKKENWTPDEDVALCKSWVIGSENSITGNDQTGDGMWTTIFKEFCEKIPKTTRTKRGLENRWTPIQGDCTKWKAVMKRVNRNYQSGTNLVDEVGAYYQVFKSDHKRDFKFIHCWEILKDSPKWHDDVMGTTRKCSNRRGVRVNATQPQTSSMEDSHDIGLDGLHESNANPCTGTHVDEDSPLHLTPTRTTPSSIQPTAPLERPLGRTSAKEKRRREVEESSVRNNKLSDQFFEWRTSQDNNFKIVQESNKIQFETMKAANELQAFHLLKKAKLEQLQASIVIIQSIGDVEDKLIRENKYLMTDDEIQASKIARFTDLKELGKEHKEILKLQYSPGGSAIRWMNGERGNVTPTKLTNRCNAPFHLIDED